MKHIDIDWRRLTYGSRLVPDALPDGLTTPETSTPPADTAQERKDDVERRDLLYQNAMALGKSPGSGILMTAFMMYMTGNTLQIFSIMMLAMALWNPSRAVLNVAKEFKKFEHPQVSLLLPKLIYVVLQLVSLGIALYKCQSLGLLPSTLSFSSPIPTTIPYVSSSNFNV